MDTSKVPNEVSVIALNAVEIAFFATNDNIRVFSFPSVRHKLIAVKWTIVSAVCVTPTKKLPEVNRFATSLSPTNVTRTCVIQTKLCTCFYTVFYRRPPTDPTSDYVFRSNGANRVNGTRVEFTVLIYNATLSAVRDVSTPTLLTRRPTCVRSLEQSLTMTVVRLLVDEAFATVRAK